MTVELSGEIASFYNLLWMLFSLVMAAGLTKQVLINPKISKEAKENVAAWVTTLLAIAVHRGFWLLALWSDVPGDDNIYAPWSGEWRWIIVIPIMVDVLIASHFVLRRMAGNRWYIAGLATIPISLLFTRLI